MLLFTHLEDQMPSLLTSEDTRLLAVCQSEEQYEINWATVCLSLLRQFSRKQIPWFSERTSLMQFLNRKPLPSV